MKLVEGLAKEVTDDPRALRWFADPGTDERIARAYRELLAGHQIDPGTILKTTPMLARRHAGAHRPRRPRAPRGLPDRSGDDPQDDADARAARAPGFGGGERDRLLLDLRAPLPAVLWRGRHHLRAGRSDPRARQAAAPRGCAGAALPDPGRPGARGGARDDGARTRARRARACARAAPVYVQPRAREPVLDHAHGVRAWHVGRRLVPLPLSSARCSRRPRSVTTPRSSSGATANRSRPVASRR